MAQRWVSPNQQRRLARIPEDKREELSQGIAGLYRTGAEFVPGVGDVLSAQEAYDAAKQGNYGTAALLATLAAIGLVPGAGDAASAAGKSVKGMADEVIEGMPNELPGNWYHGTNYPYEFKEFNPPVFVTQDPEFANKFALKDFSWGEKTSYPTYKYKGGVREEIPPGEPLSHLERMYRDSPSKAAAEVARHSPHGRVIPLRVRAENAFDYDNPEHVAALSKVLPYIGSDSFETQLRRANQGNSNWSTIERHLRKIRQLGFDGVYVKEQGRKNLALFSPTQAKSKISAPRTPDITNPDMTKAEGGPVTMPSNYSKGRWRLL